MYKSPIEIVEDIQEKVTVSMENNVVRAVQAVGINIDKHELIAALTQDKSRYEEAYEQGKRDAVKHGHWVDATKEVGWPEVRCSVCRRIGRGDYLVCPWCGARMDDAPTIDAVPVVRCRDCKWYKTMYCKMDRWTDLVTVYVAKKDDYCSYGEWR